jgi:hypothetical protein
MSDILTEIEALADKKNVRVAVLSPPQPEMRGYPGLEALIAELGFNAASIDVNREVIEKFKNVGKEPKLLKFKYENIAYIGHIQKHDPHIIYFNLADPNVMLLLLKLTQPFLANTLKNVKSYLCVSGDSLERDNILEALEFTQSSVIFNHKGYAFLERAISAPLSLYKAIEGVIDAQYSIDGTAEAIHSKLKFSLAFAYKTLMETQNAMDKALFKECELRMRLSFQTAFKQPLDKTYEIHLAD